MNRTLRPARTAAALILCSLLAACGGGGGGGSTLATPVVTATSSSANAAATFSLTIPFAATSSAAARAPQNVSPGTKSFVVALTSVNGVASTTSVETDLSSPACSATTTGTTCTVQIVAPAGTDIFVVTLYAGTGASGAVLGSATAPESIVANGSNRIALSVNGVVASLHVFLTSTSAVLGTAQTSAAYVVALDATGAEILLPGSYTAPITVTSSDTTGHVLLSVNGGTPAASVQLASPQDVLAVVFNGSGSDQTVAIGAAATGVTPASATFSVTGAVAALRILLASANGVLGTPQTSTASVAELDAAGVQLLLPYAAPVTVTSSDTGGHVLLSVNGGTPAAAVQLNSPQDILKVVFNGTGTDQTVTITATAAGATSATATYAVGGTVASVRLSLTSGNGVLGTPQTAPASVAELDATGAQILLPYTAPVTVTSSDTTGHVLVAVNGGTPAASVQLTSPQSALTIVFNGTGNAQAVAITAAATGVASVTMPYIVTGSPPVLSPTSVTFTQIGAGGTQHVTISGGVAPYFVNGTTTSTGSPAITYSVSGATITLTANGAASQTYTITDSLGQTALLPVTSSTLTVPIQ